MEAARRGACLILGLDGVFALLRQGRAVPGAPSVTPVARLEREPGAAAKLKLIVSR
jgi:hypothetical protein